MQYNYTTNDSNSEKLEPLFVGKLEDGDEKQSKFQTDFKILMEFLAEGYKLNYNKETDIGIAPCVNYNFYDNQGRFTEDDFISAGQKERIAAGRITLPEWMKKNEELQWQCIRIANEALRLSGYGEYLRSKINEILPTHNICCSVNYYDDRSGKEGFHQDSFGSELFVLLIYLDTDVIGPEWKLKRQTIFDPRMGDIKSNGFMPECFIKTLEEVYKKTDQVQPLADSEQKTNIVEDVQWAGIVPGPGGIVGMVDELMIHSTPYSEHRAPNAVWLLTILEAMKMVVDREMVLGRNVTEDETKRNLDDIAFWIGKISNQKGEDREEAERTLNMAMESLGKLEEFNYLYRFYSRIQQPKSILELLGVLVILQEILSRKIQIENSELINILQNQINGLASKPHYINIIELLESIKSSGLSFDEKVVADLYSILWTLENFGFGGDLTLGRSGHQMHNISDRTSLPVNPTQNNSRRFSQELDKAYMQEMIRMSQMQRQKRSFLRVWVTALPKTGTRK